MRQVPLNARYSKDKEELKASKLKEVLEYMSLGPRGGTGTSESRESVKERRAEQALRVGNGGRAKVTTHKDPRAAAPGRMGGAQRVRGTRRPKDGEKGFTAAIHTNIGLCKDGWESEWERVGRKGGGEGKI